jgi:beta-glucosidase
MDSRKAGALRPPPITPNANIREFFLKPFEAAVTEAHVQSVMAAYNEVNGMPVHVNQWLLRDGLLNRACSIS